MNFVEELRWRGLIADISDEAGILKLTGKDSFYVGFDPTAPSLQVGNLVPIIASIHIGRGGPKPLMLFGGATGAIGDPSGKSNERQLLERETIEANIAKQQVQMTELFERSGLSTEIVNNYDWTKDVTTLEFLREVGKYFTVNYMLQKDSVKTRLDTSGISYTEFSYMLLQAFDFLHLYQTKGCKLQVGGSDQWGNITAGMELIRKKISGEAYCLSFPLVTDSQGKKFGKSADGAVWLDPKLTSPYKFHQFWLNLEDADVISRLKGFTFLDQSTIEGLEQSLKSKPEAREAQRALADGLTTFIHGETATKDAKRSADVLFGGSMEGLSEAALLDIFADVPSSAMERSAVKGAKIVDLLTSTALAKSKSDARRSISGGGIYLNNERVSDPEAAVPESVASGAKMFVLRSGKKNYHLVKIG